MIRVENLVKKYGVHTAVDHLSFSVEKGQIYGFLGPNGAGKSTTMNIMTGYIAANGGSVTINGYDILREPEKAKRCIGYLPEIPPLYADMTVWEYLLFVAELKKVPHRERAGHITEIIEKTQLQEVRERLIKNLSKGYKQRVGLAQALVGYPEVLILDEPMVGLDPKQIIEMRNLIKEFSEEHTILLSSHILSEVSAVCDHIMIISEGKLVADGSPEALQQMMHVRAELAVTALGTKEQAETVLKQLEQVASYTVEAGQEENSVVIRAQAAEGADIRKELSVALTGAGMPILSMNRRERTLEDIFLKLTEGTDERKATDADAAQETVASETDETGRSDPKTAENRVDAEAALSAVKEDQSMADADDRKEALDDGSDL